MPAVFGKVVGGKVVVDAPADWPEGAEVRVEPIDPAGVPDPEDESPEAEAWRLARMDRPPLPGPWLSSENDARWKQALAEQKAWELARWDEESEKARKPHE